jgi:hypothetical protein
MFTTFSPARALKAVFRLVPILVTPVLVSMALISAGCPGAGAVNSAAYADIIDLEARWLASLQLPSGAIPMTAEENGTVTVNPYFANLAVLGLLEGGTEYLPAVKKYAEWYFTRLNTAQTDRCGLDATIYDYSVHLTDGRISGEEPVVINGKKHYDSADSYAATFLSVLSGYYEKSGDTAYISSRYADINRIIGVIFATLRGGLTIAAPDYPVKYLYDNAEVYRGLDDAARLFENALVETVPGAAAAAERIKTARDTIKVKLESEMYRAEGGYYESALTEDGRPAYPFYWDNFYPSAVAQLSLISSGVLPPASRRAEQLYSAFNSYFAVGRPKKDWPGMDIPDTFYWAAIAHTAALMGDFARVKTYLDNYRLVTAEGRGYPLYCAEAGHVIRAITVMLSKGG